jgi:putative endonuclease
MSWWSRGVYEVLVWRERRLARKAGSERASSASAVAPEGGRGTGHIETGRRGETLVYWYLRCHGYTVVARNRRPKTGAGELDLVAWDGPVLAFVEVKTRANAAGGSPVLSVGAEQRRRIIASAHTYLRRVRKRDVSYRFDVAGVMWDSKSGYRVCLVKDAFKGEANPPRGRHRA